MIELHDVTKRYGTKLALDQVSLTLGPGELVGLFGENGAGKTTLIKCILGLLHCGGDFDGQCREVAHADRFAAHLYHACATGSRGCGHVHNLLVWGARDQVAAQI